MKTEVIRFYEGREDVTLTAYVLEDSPEMLAGRSRPAVLICPGGAYMNCSDREGEPVAVRFAAMGYHTFVLRYSTYHEGKREYSDVGQEMEPNPHCQYPIPMQEIGRALLIIREHAEEWHVDPGRIALCGFSAGAHNCAMYATHWNRPVIRDCFQAEQEELRPSAVILGYGLSDYIYMEERTRNDPFAREMFRMSNTAYLGKTDADKETLTEVSPARNVTEDMPPAFLWATSEDGLVPVQHTILMAKALADQKIPFEMHVFEQGDHGLSVGTQASAGSWSETDNDAAKWVDLCDAWLMKRFRFDLPKLNRWQQMEEDRKNGVNEK